MIGGFLCGGILLPIAAAISAVFLWLACKILKDERPYLELYKAALAAAGITAVLTFPFKYVDNPLVAGLIPFLISVVVAVLVYANMLGMEIGKAFLTWLTQTGMMLGLCLITLGPPALMFHRAISNAIAMAEDEEGEDEELMEEEGEAPAAKAPSSRKAATEDEPEPGEPMPESSEPTPESPPDDSAVPTPEPTPTVPAEPAPVASAPPPEAPGESLFTTPAGPTFAPGFHGDAQRAFHEGRIQDGHTYLRAALLASDDKALWDNVRWCQALGRPVVGLRWGVALQMSGPPPVMPNQAAQPAAQPMGEPVDPGDNDPAGFAGDNLDELRKFTGDIGPKMLGVLPKGSLDGILGAPGEGFNAPRGIQFLGVGVDAKSVTTMAQQKGIDVLLIAAVSFKVYGLNRTLDATLNARLVDVATDKRLWASKTLSSNQMKAAMNKGQDPSGEMLRSLTDYIEHNFHLQERPDLDREKLRQRAETVAREELADPLPALVEVRYLQLKDVLTRPQAEIYYQRLVGADGAATFAAGTPEERRRIIQRYLPRSLN